VKRALSRSGKRVLHVDRNGYYGGAEAAFSLQEAESWVRSVEEDGSTDVETPTINDPPSEKRRRKRQSANFKDVRIILTSTDHVSPDSQRTSPALGFSRAYSLALSPQLIYARSTLLPTLVSSKVYRQLEFLAMGSWWIYESGDVHLDSGSPSVPGSSSGKGVLKKIPGAREDVFADKTIDLKSKRSLMRLLKQAADAETLKSVLEEWGERSFEDFLTTQYGLSAHLQVILHALTLSPAPPGLTKTSYALPRINRHLTSIGVFGPGFGSVIAKWGGLSEVAQVACRASAVGGGTYILGRGIDTVDTSYCSADQNLPCISARLISGERVRTKWIAGRQADLAITSDPSTESKDLYMARLISIVSSPLSELMPLSAEGSPPAAGAVVVFPADSFASGESPPVYIIVHSGDTGECPSDQCKSSLIHLLFLI
jgi:RAB protein geranylgeranyltransferase component A